MNADLATNLLPHSRRCEAGPEFLARTLSQDGFALLRGVLTKQQCATLRSNIESQLANDGDGKIESSSGGIVGGRNLLSDESCWRKVFESSIVNQFLQASVGRLPGIVRILFFDKPPGQSWALPLHRDRTIAVSQHPDDLRPFAKPTRKAGVPHVEADDRLLEKMVTLRVHLDPMRRENGALFVVPGSHRRTDVSETVDIECSAGDIFVMKPMLLHGSHAADPTTNLHRRTLHIETSPDRDLPGECQWHQYASISPSLSRRPM